MTSRCINVLTHCYRLLLRLYPRSFRELFADDMEVVFALLLADAAQRSSLRVLTCSFAELAAVLQRLPIEHLYARRRSAHMTVKEADSAAIRIVRLLVYGATGALLCLLAGIYVMLDYSLVVSAQRWWVTPGVCLAGLAFGALGFRSLPLARRGALLGLFVLFVVGVHTVDWHNRKSFWRDIRRVEIGMERAVVDKLMDRHRRAEITAGEGVVQVGYLQSTDTAGRGDSDGALIVFVDDRVAEIEVHFD